jgi:hypothetical protein
MAGPTRLERLEQELAGTPVLPVAGLLYLGLGVVFGLVYLVGEVTTSLFPTGWILPVVLVVTGLLMTARRRFDIVAVLWFAMAAAVFLLDLELVTRGLDLGVTDPAGFDATIIAFAFALVPLILRPQFRS